MRSRLGQWPSLSFALAMAGAVLLGPATKARATLTLEAQETTGATVNATLIAQDGSPAGTPGVLNFFGGGTTSTTVADQSAPGDSTSVDNSIALGSTTVPITFGNFSVLGSVSNSTPQPGSTFDQLISSSLSVTNNDSVAHTITLIISQTGYMLPVNPTLSATASGSFNGLGNDTTGDTANALAFGSFNNALFGMGVTVQNFSFTAPGGLAPESYSNSATVFPGNTAVPYSLTVELIFTVAGGNQLSSRNDSIVANATVPEPATLAMAFSVLPLLGLAAWRKRRKSA